MGGGVVRSCLDGVQGGGSEVENTMAFPPGFSLPHLDVNYLDYLSRTDFSILSLRSRNKVGSWGCEGGRASTRDTAKVSQPSLGKPRCHPPLFSLRNQLPWECEMEHGISKLPELPGPSVQDGNVEENRDRPPSDSLPQSSTGQQQQELPGGLSKMNSVPIETGSLPTAEARRRSLAQGTRQCQGSCIGFTNHDDKALKEKRRKGREKEAVT
ncbi:hypothetical protein F4823DRAFT_610508 [Ustulina deusta]|nr:hypothetical protein F4823DRAFT_610508 [Ustulina deusta]